MTDNIQERFEEELHDYIFQWLRTTHAPKANGYNVFWHDDSKEIEFQVIDTYENIPEYLCIFIGKELIFLHSVPNELHDKITKFYDTHVLGKKSNNDLVKEMTPLETLALNQIKMFLKYNLVTGDLSNDISIQILEKAINELEDLKLKYAKVTELLGLYEKKSDLLVQIANGKYLQDDYMKLLEKIDSLNKELGEMK